MGKPRRIIAILSVCGHDGADAELGADRGAIGMRLVLWRSSQALVLHMYEKQERLKFGDAVQGSVFSPPSQWGC